MQLHNQIDKKLLKEKLLKSDEKRVTLSFYKYFHIQSPQDYRDTFYIELKNLEVFGRIYIAKEGVNGQISVPQKKFDQFKKYMNDHTDLSGIRLNIAMDDDGKSFIKLVIKVRKKIVADGLDDETFDVTNKGKHLSAKEFNDLAKDPNTIIVDMRNHYESEVGHFKGAITPEVDAFRDALPLVEKKLESQKDKNLVMYCTGGIRCEKASAYYKHVGFKNVFQLEGGIIEYARQVNEQGLENEYIGKNFVFDERLGERISDEVIAKCHQCGEPCDDHTNCANDGCHLLFIQCKKCQDKMENCCSEKCQKIIHLTEEEQRKLRKGKQNGMKVYRKGRWPRMEAYNKNVSGESQDSTLFRN